MPDLPTRFARLILAFAPLFVHRSLRHAQLLLIGATATPGLRTVTGRVANSEVGRRCASTASLSHFVRCGKPKAVGEQLVLLAHSPREHKPKALTQPQLNETRSSV